MSLDPLLVDPFWRSAAMYGESLFFIDRGDGVATATLLFRQIEHLRLTSATGDVVYDPGRDYTVDLTSGIVSRTAPSRIPFAMMEELYPAADPFVLIADGDEFHRRQVAATYDHPLDTWRGSVPRCSGLDLPRTTQRLSASQPLTVCLVGDSISEGYNASGFTGAPPQQPPYGELVAFGLQHRWGSQATLNNLACAGWTSDDGVADVERVADTRPDLAIVAFGMNDAGYAAAADYAANIGGIMAGVRAKSADTEFVLVAPMLPNPRWGYPVTERFVAYRAALADLCGNGTALADVTSLWTDLLARKSVHDLTGNGINHPNDFGHRVYAQVILELFGTDGE